MQLFTGAYLPLHLAGQPFHRLAPSILHQLSMNHRHTLDGRFVSVPLPGLSPHTLASVASLRGERSFLKPFRRLGAIRQLTSPKKIVATASLKV